MSVVSMGDYTFESKDRVENFHGNQLVFVGWDHHLLFCAPFAFPLPPDMPFKAMVDNVFPTCFGYHPEFAQIKWGEATWIKAGKPFTPDWDKSLADNGIGHKTAIHFKTPGLNGIKGSGS